MHPVVRRTITGLSITYALAWAGAAMVVGAGSAAMVVLTGNLQLAGLFVALFSVSSAAGAASLGRAMDRFGRKPVLFVAHGCGVVGYGVAGASIATAGLVTFMAGGALLAFGFGGVLLTRVAAAEIFPVAERGRGIGWVQTSAVVGAVLGPTLLMLSDPIAHFLARDPLVLVWFLAPPLHVVALLVLTRITEPLAIARDLEQYHPVSLGPASRPVAQSGRWVVAVTVLALAAAQASMVAVMGVAGAAADHHGHGVVVLGALMLLHFVGMFGLSRVIGRMTDRFGRRNVIVGGLLLIAMGGVAIAIVPGLVGFGLGLLVVGLGWSFAYIGATTLLTDLVAVERRARVVGRADLTAQLSAAFLALAGGWWFAGHGMSGLGLIAIGVVALPVMLVVGFIRGGRGIRDGTPA